jgi:hypothetical protein
MKILQGVSDLTFIVGVLSGVAVHWVLALNAPFYVKALCVSLLLLSALILFANDFDKMRIEEMRR